MEIPKEEIVECVAHLLRRNFYLKDLKDILQDIEQLAFKNDFGDDDLIDKRGRRALALTNHLDLDEVILNELKEVISGVSEFAAYDKAPLVDKGEFQKIGDELDSWEDQYQSAALRGPAGVRKMVNQLGIEAAKQEKEPKTINESWSDFGRRLDGKETNEKEEKEAEPTLFELANCALCGEEMDGLTLDDDSKFNDVMVSVQKGKDRLFSAVHQSVIICPNDDCAMIVSATTPEEVVAKWNKRPESK